MPAATAPEQPSKTPPPQSGQENGKLPTYMHRRGDIYYFKRKIPSEFAQSFAQYRGQVWKSLGTGDLALAEQQLAKEVAGFEATVAAARADVASGVAKAPPKYPRSPETTIPVA